MKLLEFNPAYAWALIAVLTCAIIASFISLQVGVFALFLLILAWWSWQNYEESFLFLVVILPLLPMFKVTQTLDTITLLKDVIIGVLLLRVVLVPLLKKQLPYRRNVLWLPVLFLGVWIVLNMLRANSLTLGILRARDLLMYMLLYFVALYMPQTKQFYRQITGWFLASAFIVVLLGIYQWFFAVDSAVLRFNPAQKIWIPRISSTFGHPSIYGQYLILVATVLLGLAASAKKKINQFTWLALVLLTAPFVYLTYSRAVWIGYILALTMITLAFASRGFILKRTQQISWKPALASMTGLILLLIIIVRFTSMGVFLKSAFDPNYASNQDRLLFLARLISPMTNVQAIVGSGLGNVTALATDNNNVTAADIATGEARTVQVAKDSTLVDNQYLKTFVELGLIGLIIYFWSFFRLTKTIYRVIIYRTSNESFIIGLCFLGFFAAFLVQALFIDIWDIVPTNAAFWILTAFVSRESA